MFRPFWISRRIFAYILCRKIGGYLELNRSSVSIHAYIKESYLKVKYLVRDGEVCSDKIFNDGTIAKV